MNRRERQAAILEIVREQAVSTQGDLVESLRRAGHDVVQTTVSRDIHELGLVKVRHSTGRLVYAQAEDSGYNEELSDSLKRWALTVEPSGQLVVVTTPYGYASALAQAVDVARHPHIAGTIAGENTVLLVAREPATGAQLADDLNLQRLAGAA